MKEEILCCPFCGCSEVKSYVHNEGTEDIWCILMCVYCTAETETAKTREGAIENWNRRDAPDAKYARIIYEEKS